MRLSEAIRLGSVMKPQGFGSVRDTTKVACAMDAAAIAIGLEGLTAQSVGKVLATFPILKMEATCPECGSREPLRGSWMPLILCGVIAHHLNDEHRWDRDRIANWVQQFEDAHAATPPVVTTASEPVAVG